MKRKSFMQQLDYWNKDFVRDIRIIQQAPLKILRRIIKMLGLLGVVVLLILLSGTSSLLFPAYVMVGCSIAVLAPIVSITSLSDKKEEKNQKNRAKMRLVPLLEELKAEGFEVNLEQIYKINTAVLSNKPEISGCSNNVVYKTTVEDKLHFLYDLLDNVIVLQERTRISSIYNDRGKVYANKIINFNLLEESDITPEIDDLILMHDRLEDMKEKEWGLKRKRFGKKKSA